MTPVEFVILIVAMAFPFCPLRAAESESSSASRLSPLPLEPIYRLAVDGRVETLVSKAYLRMHTLDEGKANIAFHAVTAAEWIPGLTPVFARESKNTFSLHRRPRPGHENTTEPFFFALPLSSETNAINLAGRWECEATHVDGAKDYYAWDLTMTGHDVVGRFDQKTDYRFAYLTGGTFQSNRLEIMIDYINNKYHVTGVYREGVLSGQWEQTTGADHGEWFGRRPASEWKTPDESGALPLFEWKKKADPSIRRYAVESPDAESEWERVGDALCRVWRP